jgi:hypothetical protein
VLSILASEDSNIGLIEENASALCEALRQHIGGGLVPDAT